MSIFVACGGCAATIAVGPYLNMRNLDEADQLFAAGKKNEAAEKYQKVYAVAGSRKGEIVNRIVEHLVQGGRFTEALEWINRALDDRVDVSFESQDARDLLARARARAEYAVRQANRGKNPGALAPVAPAETEEERAKRMKREARKNMSVNWLYANDQDYVEEKLGNSLNAKYAGTPGFSFKFTMKQKPSGKAGSDEWIFDVEARQATTGRVEHWSVNARWAANGWTEGWKKGK